MKNNFLIFLFLLISSVCNAKYQPLLISELIDDSEFIGTGKIINIEKKQVIVTFSELIKGKLENKKISIERFENWTCASRWTKYRIGQKIMFFLKTDKDGKYIILGSGDEGELPIKGEKTYYKSLYGGLDKNSTKYLVYGSELYGIAFQTIEVKSGILEYLKNKLKFHKLAKQKNRKNRKIENPFLKNLVEELYKELYQYQ